MQLATKTTSWFVATIFAGLLIWGLAEVLRVPVAAGDVYPPYSTLRADPLGAKALYESLTQFPELAVERSYKAGPLASDTMLFLLGLDAASWIASPQPVFAEYQKRVNDGGRLIIGLVPAHTPRPVPKTETLEAEWNLHPVFDAAEEGSPSADGVPKKSALRFEAGPEWNTEEGVMERKFGRGTIVVVTESYPLSNQGLVEQRDSAWIAHLLGEARHVVFDETHFGVSDAGSVGTLIRKYRLEGALAVLAVAAALFLWRAASSFPPVRPESSSPRSVPGQDALDGMAALLRRSIPEQDLLKTCLAAWNSSSASPRDVERATQAIEMQKNVVDGYGAVCRALREKR